MGSLRVTGKVYRNQPRAEDWQPHRVPIQRQLVSLGDCRTEESSQGLRECAQRWVSGGGRTDDTHYTSHWSSVIGALKPQRRKVEAVPPPPPVKSSSWGFGRREASWAGAVLQRSLFKGPYLKTLGAGLQQQTLGNLNLWTLV